MKNLRSYNAAVRTGQGAGRLSGRAVGLERRVTLLVAHGRVGRQVAALCAAFGTRLLVHGILPQP
ncbi:MAG: hypothetical protein ACRYHQ_32960 [Janthinobacterium lividum]